MVSIYPHVGPVRANHTDCQYPRVAPSRPHNPSAAAEPVEPRHHGNGEPSSDLGRLWSSPRISVVSRALLGSLERLQSSPRISDVSRAILGPRIGPQLSPPVAARAFLTPCGTKRVPPSARQILPRPRCVGRQFVYTGAYLHTIGSGLTE